MAVFDDATAALVDGAYAAALDERLWEPWSLDMAQAFGSAGSVFFVMDMPGGAPRRVHLGLFTPKTVEEYLGGMMPLDPQVAHLATLPKRSCTYVDTDHVDYAHPPTAEYMCWSASTAKVKHHVTGVAFLNGGALVAGLSLNRGVADHPVPDAQRARFDAVFAEVVRAMELGFLHGAKLQQAHWEGVTAGLRDPALLIDERLRKGRPERPHTRFA